MKKSYKTNTQIKNELSKINCLCDSKERLERITYLLFEHKYLANIKYKDLVWQLDLFEKLIISEDLLRQYKTKKIRKIPSARRLKSIASLAIKQNSSDDLLKEIYFQIERCETQDLFEKNLIKAEKALTPIYKKVIAYQLKTERQFEDAFRVLTNFRFENDLINQLRNVNYLE
jgi:hypothetical protein